jgi:hypothetical protein
MNTNASILKFIMVLLLLLSFSCSLFAQKKQDSTFCKNDLKLDLVPFYFDFFDAREQIRIGFEYERMINRNFSVSCYIDAGLYDNYTFIKYYDFFNQNQGMYTVEQNVSIRGVHLIPSCNYWFYRAKKKANRGIYTGVILDFHYYQKKLAYLNTQTFERTHEKYYQTGLGAGLDLGGRYGFGKHFFIELKTVFLGKIYRHANKQDVPLVKPLNAQWSDNKHNFWWISNLTLGYAF